MELFLIYIAVGDKLNEPSIQQTDVQVHAPPECAALHFVSKNVADVPSQSTTMFVRSSWIFSETVKLLRSMVLPLHSHMNPWERWDLGWCFWKRPSARLSCPQLKKPVSSSSLNHYLESAFKNKARQNPNQPCQNVGWIIRWRSLKFASLKTYIDYSVMES